MINSENIGGFVFVACGSAEHLDTLAFSYQIIASKTQHTVYVVTDHTRNEHSISYPHLIDIKCPETFDHHQASIWLKTSLHKILPSNKIYAYLDTDILATGEHIDEIFKEYMPPIIFAPDHCKLSQFGLYAVNCGCLNLFEKKRVELKALQELQDPCSISKDQDILEKRKKLFSIFDQVKRNGKLTISFYLKYFLSWPRFNISPEFYYDKRKKIWADKDGKPIMHHVNMRKLGNKIGLKWNPLKNELTLPDGRNIWTNNCHHLPEKIKKKFNIQITDNNWQHWNGGVFLFAKESYEFMDTWHHFTMEIFKDPEWKTRDQGTLIATAWKYGLENHATLNIKWNAILDYYNQQLEVFDDGSITVDGKTKILPELVHIYHHWGDKTWPIWNHVIKKLEVK